MIPLRSGVSAARGSYSIGQQWKSPLGGVVHTTRCGLPVFENRTCVLPRGKDQLELHGASAHCGRERGVVRNSLGACSLPDHV